MFRIFLKVCTFIDHLAFFNVVQLNIAIFPHVFYRNNIQAILCLYTLYVVDGKKIKFFFKSSTLPRHLRVNHGYWTVKNTANTTVTFRNCFRK